MHRKFLSIIAAISLTLGSAAQAMEQGLATVTTLKPVGLGVISFFAPEIKQEYQLKCHKQRMDDYIGGNTELRSFIESYSLPTDVYEEFVKNEKEIYSQIPLAGATLYKNSWYIKGYLDCGERILYAQRLKNYINKKGYTTITVPEKFIFLAGNKWITIAKAIKQPDTKITFSLLHAQELMNVATELGFYDSLDSYSLLTNIMQNDKGQSMIIDTEKRSFCYDTTQNTRHYQAVNARNLVTGLSEYSQRSDTIEIDANTMKWLENQAVSLNAKCLNSKEPYQFRINDTTLDNIDMAKIHKALSLHLQRHRENNFFK